MSRRRRAENPVSLFPFVAVMASTMGALILLLLVTARQASKARDAAWLEQRKQTKPLPKLPPLPGLVAFPDLPPLPPHQLPELVERPLPALPPLTDPRSAILSRRERIESELADLRDKRERTPKAGEERLAPMMREAALLRSRLERILEERRKSKATEKETIAKAEELEAEKKLAEERRQRSPHKYAVTPYFGPNATSKRPIYLECTADAIVLRPEGVSVSTAALEHDARADNPLARLVYAVTEHRAKSDPQPPYPLLVVRPGGVHSYYVARSALEFLRYPFGYELIAAEQELAYPAADNAIKQLAESAIIETQPPRTFANGGGSRNGVRGGDGSGDGDARAGGAGPGISNPTNTQAAVNGVVPAVMPKEAETPAEEPAEIGASVRDYIARRHGGSGSTPGLGALSASAPTPFERLPSRERTNGGVANRTKRERDQARVERDLNRQPPLLSQRLQEMVDEAPIPLPSARPQTQQWQPGLEGIERTPSANEQGVTAPTGVWSATRNRSNGAARSNEPPPSPGAQLWQAANQRGFGQAESGRDHDSGAVRYIERFIQVEVRASSLMIGGTHPVPLSDKEEVDAATRAVAAKCFESASQWAEPPHGAQWKPCVLLLVRNGANQNAFGIRGALSAIGFSVKQIWIDGQGVPTLVPSWGN